MNPDPRISLGHREVSYSQPTFGDPFDAACSTSFPSSSSLGESDQLDSQSPSQSTAKKYNKWTNEQQRYLVQLWADKQAGVGVFLFCSWQIDDINVNSVRPTYAILNSTGNRYLSEILSQQKQILSFSATLPLVVILVNCIHLNSWKWSALPGQEIWHAYSNLTEWGIRRQETQAKWKNNFKWFVQTLLPQGTEICNQDTVWWVHITIYKQKYISWLSSLYYCYRQRQPTKELWKMNWLENWYKFHPL